MRFHGSSLLFLALAPLLLATEIRCASSGGSTGAAGQSGGGTTGAGTAGGATAGTTGMGAAPAGAGSAGTIGTSGSGTGTGGTGTGVGGTGVGGTGVGGRVTGTAGTGGSSVTGKGGTMGSAGSPGVFTRYKCPAGPFTNPTPSTLTPTRISGVPTPDATINQNGSAFSIVEGPVWIDGALYFSEIQNSSAFPQPGAPPPPARMFKITPDDVASVFIPDSGSNGLAIDASGNLVSANHKVGGIVSFSLPAGTPTTLVGTYMGTRFISPNDLTVRSDGTIYFTDPSYQGAASASSQTQTRVYRLPPGSTAVSVVDATLSNPNGITLSLDETKLYITDTSGLHVYPVSSDGSVGSGSRLAQGMVSGGDGMTIDCAGNLYVAITSSGNLAVVSPAGTLLGNIAVSGVQAVTNAAFGGSDHKTLYITAQGGGMSFGQGGNTAPGLFKVTMPLPGMPY